MTLNRKVTLAFAFAILASAALIGVAAAAFGSTTPVQRGAACAHVGQVAANRQGVKYICEERAGDGCPRWHALNPQPGPWPSRSTLPCAKCSPSPSKPASASASSSPSHPASTSTTAAGSPMPPPVSTAPVPVTDQLPVTGLSTVVSGALWTGGLLLLAGVLFVVVPRVARRRNP